MQNINKIRRYNIEEMANFIRSCNGICGMCICCKYNSPLHRNCKSECIDGIKEWLSQGVD